MQPLRLLCINYAHFYWKLHAIPYPKLIPPPATPPSPTLAILIAHIHLHSRPRHCHTQSQTWLQQLHIPLYSSLSLPPYYTHTFFTHTHTHIYCSVTSCSLQSILSRSLLNAGRRIAGLLWHIALLFEYIPNAIRDALVPREGEYRAQRTVSANSDNEKMSYVIDFVCSYLHLMWLLLCSERARERVRAGVVVSDCCRRQSIN